MKKYNNGGDYGNLLFDDDEQERGQEKGQDRKYPMVKELDDHEKPRERLIKQGPSNLSSVELLAVILGVGTRREEVLTMAHRIFKDYGEKSLAFEEDPNTINKELDIPIGKACQIIACFELGRRFFAKRKGRQIVIRTAKDVFEHLKDLGALEKEQLRGLYLNSYNKIIHEETISVGTLTASLIHPREVFRPAVEHNAVSIILAHNHPSGRVKPSASDIEVTRQLVKSAKMIGIRILDHVIVTEKTYKSIDIQYNNY